MVLSLLLGNVDDHDHDHDHDHDNDNDDDNDDNDNILNTFKMGSSE